MHPFYTDYVWKAGKPVGRDPHPEGETLPVSYKIITDPYFKHYSVERYHFGKYETLVYDSQLLDFRKLKPEHQQAWQSETVEVTKECVSCLIRDGNDRLILKEVHTFEEGLPKQVELFSLHGWHLLTTKLYYSHLGDAFSGALLFDREKRPVLKKTYQTDEAGNFLEVLKEEWEGIPSTP